MIPDLAPAGSRGVFPGTRYIQCVRAWIRQNYRFFLIALLLGLLLRLFFLFWYPRVTDDSQIYADIAINWLHGTYGLTQLGKVVPTCIRLPGYPAFLAIVFAIFGRDDFRAIWVLQILFDLATCALIADMARRLISPRAAKAALLLAALCPFLANYASAALTETLEVFFTAFALDFALAGLASLPSGRRWRWFACGVAIAGAILLRPDGGLLLVALGVYLAWLWIHVPRNPPSPAQQKSTRAHLLQAALVVSLTALAPLVPWTIRNLHTLHFFEPLAPRYSNDPDEFVPLGFDRWVKTWMADYVSVEDVYWQVSGNTVDINKLPPRAFDSAQQREETAQLLSDYNHSLHVTPELDARFAALAATRIHAAPLRYYAWLPLLRIADMWLRPRAELLPSDSRWWQLDDDPSGSAISLSLGVIGLLYIALAIGGILRGGFAPGIGLLAIFVIFRSIFLGSLENPEPRYVLECYPVVILLGSALFGSKIPKTVSSSVKLDSSPARNN